MVCSEIWSNPPDEADNLKMFSKTDRIDEECTSNSTDWEVRFKLSDTGILVRVQRVWKCSGRNLVFVV